MRNMTQASNTIAISEKSKTKDWYEKKHKQILSSSSATVTEIDEYKRNLDIFSGRIDQDDYSNVARTPNGKTLGLRVENFNKVSTVVRQFVGELQSNPLNPEVTPISRYAINRRTNELIMKEVAFALAPFMKAQEQATGIPLVPDDTPQSMDEMDMLRRNYKDVGSIIFGRIARHIIKDSNLPMQMGMWAKDVILSARAMGVVNREEEGVKIDRVQPTNCLFDRYMRPDGDGLTYWTWMEYIPVSIAMTKFGITKAEIEEIKGSMESGSTSRDSGFSSPFSGPSSPKYPWITRDNEERILFSASEWIDEVDLLGLKSISTKTGFQRYSIQAADLSMLTREERKKAKQRVRNANRVDKKKFSIIRYCIMLGNSKVVDYGVAKPIRNYETWNKASFRLSITAPMWEQDTGATPIMSEVVILNQIINEAWHKLRLALKNDIGDVMPKDMAHQPSKLKPGEHDYILRTAMTYLYNSLEKGIPLTAPQMNTINLGIKNERVSALAAVISMCSQHIEEITGFSKGRLSRDIPSSTPVGLNDANMVQSRIGTIMYTMGIEHMVSDLLTKAVSASKEYIQRDPDKWSHIIGDDGVALFKANPDMDLADYGIGVKSVHMDPKKQQMLVGTISSATQSGQADLRDALVALRSDNIDEASDHIIRAMDAREKAAAAMKQQEMKAAQEAQAQNAQVAQGQNQIQAQKVNNDAMVAKENIRMKQQEMAANQRQQEGGAIVNQ